MTIYGMAKKTKHGVLIGNKIVQGQNTVMFGKYKKSTPHNIVSKMLKNDEDDDGEPNDYFPDRYA